MNDLAMMVEMYVAAWRVALERRIAEGLPVTEAASAATLKVNAMLKDGSFQRLASETLKQATRELNDPGN